MWELQNFCAPQSYVYLASTVVNYVLPQFGWTPLHDAAQENNQLAVMCLLKAGADANLLDMVRQQKLVL